MGLASEVAGAISEGINSLCALLVWIDAGGAQAPPVDGAELRKVMVALEEAMREIMHGGRLSGAELWHLTEADLASVIRLEVLSAEWTSTGALPPEVATLADGCVKALCGGTGWKDLMAASPPRNDTGGKGCE